MEVYVKESLHVLDYKNKIVDSIFLSDDKVTPGYAYDITITEANTGYSDLKFSMPNMVIDDEGNKIQNPKLKLLTPLVKLRYHREVYYRGEKEITVREPQGYGDKVVYVDKTYKPTYPDNIIEDYVMDYIVQPVDRKREVLKLTTMFTAIDYPRFNLSKKKVGLTIAQETMAADPNWSLYTNKPIDVAGQVHYQLWTKAAYGQYSSVEEWDPARADHYPLTYDAIFNLVRASDTWAYGKLGTAFYWPIVSTGRFEGKLYTEGGYLVLQLYDYLALGKEGISPEQHVDQYGWEWSYLEEVDKRLAPNNALNYLQHILHDTNWSVAKRADGSFDVDIERKTIPNPDGSLEKYRVEDSTCNLSISNGNCYNAITSLCQAFQLYPIYDCEKRTVALRIFSGKNYGLTYRLGANLTSNAIKNDGEKVITKLYVAGGQDNKGGQSISIGEAERSYIVASMLPTEYQQIDYIESTGTQYIDTGVILTEQHGVRLLFKPTAKNSSVVFGSRTSATANNFAVLLSTENNAFNTVVDFYNYQKNRLQQTVELNTPVLVDMDNLSLSVNEKSVDINTYAPFTTPGSALIFSGAGNFPWTTKASMQLYECVILENGTVRKQFIPCYRKSDGVAGLYETIERRFYTNAGTGTFIKGPSGAGDPDNRLPWNPNDPGYIIKRSPYGTNYILNFKWMYDNGWMSKEDILGLYSITEKIDKRNREFMPSYTQDRYNTIVEYNTAINDYDIKQGEYQSTLNSMMNKYYNVYGEISEGYFYAFHRAPLGTHKNGNKNYVWIGHCKNCGYTESFASKPSASSVCTCSDPKIDIIELYIPVYADFPDVVAPSKPQYPYGPQITNVAYEPLLKGDYLKLLTTLDNENADWTITQYEEKVSIIEPIQFKAGSNTIDDREYQIGTTWVKASSAHIDEWNEDIALFVKAYGEMLDAEDKINHCLLKLQRLEERYNEWKEEYDGYHAEIQKLYGDYIVEGNYTNNEQPYVGLLFEEGMEASDKFAIPEVTYNLDVIDSTGLIEYRQPIVSQYECADCHYVDVVPVTICPKCNGTNIVKSYDTYNDLVHTLHSVGQIVPKSGDYVTIYDEPMGLFGVPGMITEISRTLDKPINNKIKLDTGYTDDEELVGNIITATNTVLNHADIYARTAILRADGTIDSESITKTIDNPNASLNIVGTNGNMLLTNSYLRFTNPTDPTKAMKYSGTGVYSTTTLTESGVATDWQKMMTPSGINATYINAGQIDVKNVSIMSGLSSKILLDQYGLVVKNVGNKSAHISAFDATRAKNEANYTRNWSESNNIAGFMGVDPDNKPVLYTKGFLVAENGSNIAGWVTSTDAGNAGFFHLKDNTTTGEKDLWLSPTGIRGTVNGETTDYAIYSKGTFGVTTGGVLQATGAKIKGSGEFSGTITSNASSKIAGTVDADLKGLKADAVILSADGISGSQYGVIDCTGPWAIYSKGNFGVTTAGKLYANGAKIKGHIEADSGTFNGTVYASDGSFTGTVYANAGEIGGCSITNGTLQIKNANIDTLSVSKITGGNNSANITFAGNIICNNLTAKTSGNVGGWTIHSDKLKSSSGNSELRSDGSAYFYPQSGAGAEYLFNDGMTLHSTAAQTLSSGANIMIDASTNLNLKAGSGAYMRFQAGLGIRINGPISVSRGYDDARESAVDWTGIIHIDGTNKEFKFVNGILVGVNNK